MNGGKLPDGLFEIGQGAGKAGGQLASRHVVVTLADTHGDAFFGTTGISQANEAHDRSVTLLSRQLQKSHSLSPTGSEKKVSKTKLSPWSTNTCRNLVVTSDA